MIGTSIITWRIFLDDLCRRMKASEKQDFATALGVSKTTINRWRRGQDCPKAINLERMLSTLPGSQSQQLLALLRKDPKMWSLLSTEMQTAYPLDTQDERSEQIPLLQRGLLDHFCLKMLRLQRDTPDRFWQLSGSILREALKQLETHPVQTGLEIVVAKCMPMKNGKVRSLRVLVGMGTPPWRGDLHAKDFFLGIESLAGYAITSRHGEMIPNIARRDSQVPAHVMEHAQSAAAFPIMRGNCVAGALLVTSIQTDYFTPERMALLEVFSDIMRLAFYDNETEFHPLSCIELGLMPPCTTQRTYLDSFRQRVEGEYRRASREAPSMQELMGVEERVRGQLEDELLGIAGSEETANHSS